jgi:hypothetical protein
MKPPINTHAAAFRPGHVARAEKLARFEKAQQ